MERDPWQDRWYDHLFAAVGLVWIIIVAVCWTVVFAAVAWSIVTAMLK